MNIGSLQLGDLPLFLAPMEDVTYKSFRYMCKKYGADVMTTEFISSEALVRNVEKTKKKMTIFDFDRPVAIQIYGHDISSMVHAAQVVEEVRPDYIDLNFGCPMKKIASRGDGAGMLRDIPKLVKMTSEIVKAVHLPVTVKTRLGWDDTDKPIVTMAEQLQDVGISALTIHGRTRSQIYAGKADWSLIAQVKKNPRMHIPIIGNGDITGPVKAKELYEYSGVDGLMVGRAAIGRPWIFQEIKHYFETGKLLLPPTVQEIVENVKEQLKQSVSWKEEERSAILEMRRHFARYFPGLPDFRNLRILLLQAQKMDEVLSLLEQIANQYYDQRVEYSAAD